MEDDDILYHYTSIGGLHSIIQSRKVWASDCRFLNDKKELIYAIDLFLSKVEERYKEPLDLAFHWHTSSRAHCVFCLSRSPKVLSQWRAYSEDGKGAALGFKRKFLMGLTKKPSKFLLPCIYQNHDEFIESVISTHKSEIDKINELQQSNPAINGFWKALDETPSPIETLYSQILRIKNEAFIEEQEERLILNVSRQEVKTRVSEGLIIPYVEHTICEQGDESFLSYIAPEIWFGPKSDDRNLDSIRFLNQDMWTLRDGIHRYDCGYV